jgi:large subunit ribosomal protein L14
MISYLTCLEVADNSGARKVQCIKILGGSFHKTATIGDLIVTAIKKAKPGKKVKKGEVKKALIVRIKKKYQRYDASSIQFSSNAVILLNSQMNPIGTRVFGPVTRELRQKQWTRILTLAPSIL